MESGNTTGSSLQLLKGAHLNASVVDGSQQLNGTIIPDTTHPYNCKTCCYSMICYLHFPGPKQLKLFIYKPDETYPALAHHRKKKRGTPILPVYYVLDCTLSHYNNIRVVSDCTTYCTQDVEFVFILLFY